MDNISSGRTGMVKVGDQEYDVKRALSRIVNFGSFSGLYALALICISAVLILASFFGVYHDRRPSNVIYFHIFNIIVQGIGAIFIFALYAIISKKKKRANKESGSDNRAFDAGPSNSNQLGDSTSSNSMGVFIKGLTIDEIRERYENFQPVSFEGEGISFFSQMGLLGFGLGATLLDGTRLMQYINNPDVWTCYGGWYIASTSVNIFFIWVLIFFLLKHHNAVINFNFPVIKFGMCHLMATNIGTWITTVVIEGASYTVLTNATTNNTQDYGKILISGCIREVTIHDLASPYLYPFTIEFSLLAAAITYRIYLNIGGIIVHGGGKKAEEDEDYSAKRSVDCHKAHTGLSFGFLVFLCIICATVLYIFYDSGPEHEMLAGHPAIELTHFIYAVTTICGGVICLSALIPTALKLRNLVFNSQLDSLLDQYLLVVGVVGYYMLFGLIAMAAINALSLGEKDHTIMAGLLITVCILEYIQATILSIALIDGLHRRAGTPEHESEKPGRSLVTFQIILNMGMWIVNTFLLKGLHHMELFADFYGHQSWDLMVKVFLPLSIFFRFHTSVCFADIWQNAYKMEMASTVRFLDIAHNFEETLF